ncbi:MAG: hypothetical protein OXF88_06550 [Rhodobacteraceae bacterium]|nr:hypothetical protein [Paracoccaceae bacterium]MCY4137428.1 hypothetical protein [Paracoccaceae bacterium]
MRSANTSALRRKPHFTCAAATPKQVGELRIIVEKSIPESECQMRPEFLA